MRATRWIDGEGDEIKSLGGHEYHWSVDSISRDGRILAGERRPVGPSPQRQQNESRIDFYWESGSVIALAKVDQDRTHLPVQNVSSGGNVSVGHCRSSTVSEAVVWATEHGVRSLQEFAYAAGIDFGGWQLLKANAISPYGTAIVGIAAGSNNQQSVFSVALASKHCGSR